MIPAVCGPFDCIPPEILCRIFELVSGDWPCTIPPDVREPPWLLGQVCSHWRKVSRSIQSLWKTQIIVFGQAHYTFPSASGSKLPDYRFSKRSFDAVEGAIGVLPPGSRIAIEVAPSFESLPESDSISSHDAVKFLPHVQELRWRLPLNPAIFPPGSLAEIEQLSIDPHPTFLTQNDLAALSADQFGPSPRLQKLNILTLAPHFLSSGIPLSRLRCLKLDTIHRLWPTDHSVWRDFFMSRANDFSNLHEISVVADSKLVEIILQANLPWHQFTLFNLASDGSLTSLSPLLDRLRLSTHLTNLGLSKLSTKHEPPHYRDDNPVTLPFLQTLEAGSDIPFSLVKHWISSSNLLCLDVEISLSNFYSVLRQSLHLMKVTFSLSPSTDLISSVYSPSIVLPYLTHLSLSLSLQQGQEWSPASFPTLLIAPDLLSLEICVEDGGSFPLNFTIDLINRSRARLSSIECYFKGPTPLEPNESITLLNALENADTVNISNFILSHAVLDSFAKGDLLPRVRSLTLSVWTLKQFVSTINKRLSYEETCGSIRLRNIVGFVADDFYDENVADDRDPDLDHLTVMTAVQEIKERYGVECDIDCV
ncbi:hypothetical protein H0H93_004905 [Arthromyces matolae]|nr:hypothetical protein H0H93_004905 [Arthromyces matolae]